MKKNSLILLLFLVSVIGFFYWWKSREKSQNLPATAQKTPAVQGDVSSNDLAHSPASDPDDYKRRVIATVHDAAQKANQPIEFYGKVIDQNGDSIPEVRVKLSVRWTKELLPGTAKDEFNRFELMTDAQGLFKLTGEKGSLLGINGFEKEGYEPSQRALRQSYWYWAVTADRKYTPDSQRPEIFHMWKKAGADRLVRKGIGHGIPYDGTPTSFDLLSGMAVASGGDLRVTLTRNPQQIRWGQSHYEWTATIEVVNGGIVESTDEQMYRAPAEGYAPKLVIQMAANDPQWTDTKDVTAYLKMRDGKYYGRVELKFMVGADRKVTPFSIVSFINPSGSQNLEYDSSQDWKPDVRVDAQRQNVPTKKP